MSLPAAPSSLASPASQPSRALNVGLWVAQVLLAVAFLGAGVMKLVTPIAELAAQMDWAASAWLLVRFIGLAEVAGALGLILPAATRIKPVLTGLAGVGLAVVMVLAVGFHLVRGEGAHVGGPVVLGAVAVFVAWARLKRAPIAPRG